MLVSHPTIRNAKREKIVAASPRSSSKISEADTGRETYKLLRRQLYITQCGRCLKASTLCARLLTQKVQLSFKLVEKAENFFSPTHSLQRAVEVGIVAPVPAM